VGDDGGMDSRRVKKERVFTTASFCAAAWRREKLPLLLASCTECDG